MDIQTDGFRVNQGADLRLKHWPTLVDPLYQSSDHYKKCLSEHVAELKSLQERLYAHGHYALLLIFQGMDAAGKDSAIEHVMSGVNPQGCQVYSFKQPSAKELGHDFLWRATQCLPERGSIGIFNRSYYEDVLIVRVHPELLGHQRLPKELMDPKTVWTDRFKSIVDLECHLVKNGTKIIKYFLHLSKDEQRQRFLDRMDKPEKNWKLSPSDLKERTHWDDYQKAYEECLAATSKDHAPWYIVPADDKKNARLIISKVIVETLQSLALTFPEVSKERRKELSALRQLLESEA